MNDYTQNDGNMHCHEFANLMGVDGLTERTGESNRPIEVYFAKGPNLREVVGAHALIMLHKHGNKHIDGSS